MRTLYMREFMQRKQLFNQIQEMRGNIRVFCRCRHDNSARSAITFPSDTELQVVTQQGHVKKFEFEKVFQPTSKQTDVFEDTLPIITSCVDGYNVCLMAYGQTGAGKTYTMMGTDSDPGINIRALTELLKTCSERKQIDYTLKVSMLEVYNETLIDLLRGPDAGGVSVHSKLSIQKKGKGITVPGLTEVQVTAVADIKGLMDFGGQNRTVAMTAMNTSSSRSHLMLKLYVDGVDRVSKATTHGSLMLLDLAGSERISRSGATGERLVEAAAINKSLSALGQVFNALRTSSLHIPYRNSKLTHLLQPALGGDAKACLFVNISPRVDNIVETISTLQFGTAARQVALGEAKQNVG
ncbi:uncharacterized protein LOC135825817 [Sycon ciliatum]|uniref:uncharacterized protein LOC135825817 n=1 Tax=Sycon ciliatum TaxID=27933 RepID=UPI0031F6045B